MRSAMQCNAMPPLGTAAASPAARAAATDGFRACGESEEEELLWRILLLRENLAADTPWHTGG